MITCWYVLVEDGTHWSITSWPMYPLNKVPEANKIIIFLNLEVISQVLLLIIIRSILPYEQVTLLWKFNIGIELTWTKKIIFLTKMHVYMHDIWMDYLMNRVSTSELCSQATHEWDGENQHEINMLLEPHFLVLILYFYAFTCNTNISN